MTGAEWLAYVKRTFIRNDKDDEIYESTTDVIQMLMNAYPFDDYKTIKSDASIASGNSFALPDDFMRLTTLITVDYNNDGWTLNHLSPTQFEDKYASYTADSSLDGYPADFCIVGGYVFVGPRPESYTMTYKFIYEYYQDTAIGASTTTVPFTTVNRKMLKHFVLGALYQDLENNELASYHTQIGTGLLQDIVSVEDNNVTGVSMVAYQD